MFFCELQAYIANIIPITELGKISLYKKNANTKYFQTKVKIFKYIKGYSESDLFPKIFLTTNTLDYYNNLIKISISKFTKVHFKFKKNLKLFPIQKYIKKYFKHKQNNKKNTCI